MEHMSIRLAPTRQCLLVSDFLLTKKTVGAPLSRAAMQRDFCYCLPKQQVRSGALVALDSVVKGK